MEITPDIKNLIARGLDEDLGPGDLTTDILIEPHLAGRAIILAKQDFTVAGLDAAREVFRQVDTAVNFRALVQDGHQAKYGNILAELKGPAAAILKGERLALNLLQHLSGIATLTRAFVNAIAGLPSRIVDTRKTLPGLRGLEKYAVRVGGGHNHRFGLYDGVLIKDNHLKAVPLTEAVKRAKAVVPHLTRVEVEVSNLEELQEAVEAGAECILLDNMDLEMIKKAVSVAKGKAVLEASGGVTLETVRSIAETGVDLISAGALTHSAKACDISLRLVQIG